MGALFLKHRRTPLVKASGGVLSGLALVCLGASCLSLLLFLGQPGNTVCRLQMPLNSIFPTVAVATITVISLRVRGVTAAGASLDLTIRGYSAGSFGNSPGSLSRQQKKKKHNSLMIKTFKSAYWRPLLAPQRVETAPCTGRRLIN